MSSRTVFRAVFFVTAALAIGSSCQKVNPPQPRSTGVYQSRDTTRDINHLLASSQFSFFYKAWRKIHLDTTVTIQRDFTVFAPTDTAFMRIGLSLSSIDTMAARNLIRLIRYHVVYGALSDTVLSALPYSVAQKTIRQDSTIDPLQGAEITSQYVYLSAIPSLTINGKPVLQSKPPVKAANGYIFALDSVLSAPTKTLAQLILQRPELRDFSYLMQNGGQLDNLSNVVYVNQISPDRRGNPIDLVFATVFAPVNTAFQSLGLTDSASIVDFQGGALPSNAASYVITAPATLFYNDFFGISNINQGYYNASQRFAAYPLYYTFTAGVLGIKWSYLQGAPDPYTHGPTHVVSTGKNILGINGIIQEIDSAFYPQ